MKVRYFWALLAFMAIIGLAQATTYELWFSDTNETIVIPSPNSDLNALRLGFTESKQSFHLTEYATNLQERYLFVFRDNLRQFDSTFMADDTATILAVRSGVSSLNLSAMGNCEIGFVQRFGDDPNKFLFLMSFTNFGFSQNDKLYLAITPTNYGSCFIALDYQGQRLEVTVDFKFFPPLPDYVSKYSFACANDANHLCLINQETKETVDITQCQLEGIPIESVCIQGKDTIIAWKLANTEQLLRSEMNVSAVLRGQTNVELSRKMDVLTATQNVGNTIALYWVEIIKTGILIIAGLFALWAVAGYAKKNRSLHSFEMPKPFMHLPKFMQKKPEKGKVAK